MIFATNGSTVARNEAARHSPIHKKQRNLEMKRSIILAYGTVCYVMFLATFLYAIGFIGNFATPTTLDGEATGALVPSLVINLAVLVVFAVQHSVMARPAFKTWWTRIVPQAAERSTYVLFSSLAMIIMFAYWQPLGGAIWTVTDPLLTTALYGVFAMGWAVVLAATFLINHFDLFGLRQVWLEFTGKPYTPLKFGTPWLYKYVRHPLYVGWLMVFWATPTMTAAHLLFAIVTTLYILVAIQLEERDLVAEHGKHYAEYRQRVPMLIPRFGKEKPAAQTV
jgi:protein-S-isoprenylcysteine O-methyltransferase Ste14